METVLPATFKESSTNLGTVSVQNDATNGMSIGTVCSGEDGDFIRFHTGASGNERLRISANGTSTFKKRVIQTPTAVAALEIDCATSNYFTKAISANSTFTFANVPSSDEAYGFVLELDVSGDRTLTWPAAVKWSGGSTPTLTADKTHLFSFITVDGGTTWRGSAAVDFTT